MKNVEKFFIQNIKIHNFVLKNCSSKNQIKEIPEKEELISNFLKLGSSKKVGKIYKVSHTTVNNWIKRLGIQEEIEKIRKTNQNKEDK